MSLNANFIVHVNNRASLSVTSAMYADQYELNKLFDVYDPTLKLISFGTAKFKSNVGVAGSSKCPAYPYVVNVTKLVFPFFIFHDVAPVIFFACMIRITESIRSSDLFELDNLKMDENILSVPV
jgi:hypothetical protein